MNELSKQTEWLRGHGLNILEMPSFKNGTLKANKYSKYIKSILNYLKKYHVLHLDYWKETRQKYI